MAKSSSKSATLDIRAADQGTEIFVIDSSLKRIGKGLGHLEASVEPGVYKVRFRSGASIQDKLVEAVASDEPVPIQGEPVHFASAVPLEATRTTHEYHQGPAGVQSQELHRRIGSQGRLFLFVREVEEDQAWQLPGVSVHRLDKTGIASLDDGEENPDERWAALSIELDPGTYGIRVDSKHLGQYEIFVTVSKFWQTQVFLTMEDFWRGGSSVRLPSLRTAAQP